MNELQEEEEKLRKIINIVQPTTLPELTKPQSEENIPKAEKFSKDHPTSNSSQSPIKPIIPVEVNTNIDNKIKPDVKKKVKAFDDEEQNIEKEAEGIICLLLISMCTF